MARRYAQPILATTFAILICIRLTLLATRMFGGAQQPPIEWPAATAVDIHQAWHDQGREAFLDQTRQFASQPAADDHKQMAPAFGTMRPVGPALVLSSPGK